MAGLRLQPKLMHSKSNSHNETTRVLNLDRSHSMNSDCVKPWSKHFPYTEVQGCLKQEILQTEKKLYDQIVIRSGLEQAGGCSSSSSDAATEISAPKSAMELIEEIAVLKLEIVYLEQHLLSLYRKIFDLQVPPSLSAKEKVSDSPSITSRTENAFVPLKESQVFGVEDGSLNSDVHRCSSSLSLRSNTTHQLPSSLTKSMLVSHSQPLSMIKFAQNTSPNIISLAEHLETHINDQVMMTPNMISEDMIKCMSTIYCKLAESSLSNHSPSSSKWCPTTKKDLSFDVRFDNLYEKLKYLSDPCMSMVDEKCMYDSESQTCGHIRHWLQHYRSLIFQLEEVNPEKLKHDEKLAFWINIHNALAMHAHLSYGIPQSNSKRVIQVLKAAYNIGGQTISVDAIHRSILGCRMSRPGQVHPKLCDFNEFFFIFFRLYLQWLQLLQFGNTVFKNSGHRDRLRHPYAIEHHEPLLHFGLCSGSYSDPMVRAYTAKQVVEELEAAKLEYINANIGVRKDHKILLPKLVESFFKDQIPLHESLNKPCKRSVLDMVQTSLPDSLTETSGMSHKKSSIQWIPHNFSFRYLICK